MKKKWQSTTRNDLIIEVWEALDCESVGARELEQIQDVLVERFGKGALESPASIARTVADEGAVLRHPEVFECDLKWREDKLAASRFQFNFDFSDSDEALKSFAKLEQVRAELKDGFEALREVVSTARHECLLIARAKIIKPNKSAEAKEIAEWLKVWLESPQLFPDWLDLRLRSADYRKKFPKDNLI